MSSSPSSSAGPFGPRASVALVALVLALAESRGGGPNLPPDTIRLAGLFPILALLSVPLIYSPSASSTEGSLSIRTWLPLGAGAAVYLALGAILGVAAQAFQLFVEPAFCGYLFVVALVFVDVRHSQLVSAVDYYEESIDSLYDLLLSTGTAMRSETFLQDVVDNMIRAVVERTGASGGILLLSDEFEETVSVRALCGTYPPPFKLPENLPKDAERVESFVRHARFKLGEGILGEVSRTGKHVFIPQAVADSGLPDNGDEPWLKAGAFIASPLIVRDRIIGAVSVVKSGEGTFSERDFDRCKILANFGSIAVANSFSFLEAAERGDIEREADIAANLQADLLPKRFPDLRGFSFGVYSQPARGVCSDYYDVIPTRSDRAVVAVGDVAGKGVAASIVLVMVRSILQLITASTKDTATLLQWVNRGITGKVDLDHYATLCLATVDSPSGSVELLERRPPARPRLPGGHRRSRGRGDQERAHRRRARDHVHPDSLRPQRGRSARPLHGRHCRDHERPGQAVRQEGPGRGGAALARAGPRRDSRADRGGASTSPGRPGPTTTGRC